MTETLIISPKIGQYTPIPAISSIDHTISFHCQKINHNNKEFSMIILDGKNAPTNISDFYLTKKSLLQFFINDKTEEADNGVLSLENYTLKGFFRGSLSFKILKIKEYYNNRLKIEVTENLFNSDSKTLLLPINNEQVKKVIFPYRETWEEYDEDIKDEVLKISWDKIKNKEFSIQNIDGEKCYFENGNLILNEFGGIKQYDDNIIIQGNPVEELEEKSKELQEILQKYEEEVQKNKQLLTEKQQLIQKNKQNSESSYWDEVILKNQLDAANQKIKKLEAEKAKFDKQLKDLHDFAKNGSTSRLSTPNNSSNLKTQLSQLQVEQNELKNKLEEEEKKNKDLTQQIQQLTNSNNSVSLWQKVKMPVIISGTVIGMVLLLLLIYNLTWLNTTQKTLWLD